MHQLKRGWEGFYLTIVFMEEEVERLTKNF